MYKSNVNCSVLKAYLDFLLKQGLIEERTVGKSKVVYANTVHGTAVLKAFRELQKELPIKEESRISPTLY